VKNEKKEKLANWILTIVLFALILPWSGIISRLASSVKEQMSKPFISQELFNQKWSEVRAIFDQAESKGKDYAALDYARGIIKISLIQDNLELKYRFDPWQAEILSHWRDNYSTLREWIKEKEPTRGIISTMALSRAMAQAQQEVGMNGAIYDIVTKARITKFLKWLFLFAWPLSLFPILLLYIRRCQIREISFKELVILNPLKFLGCWIFGLIGLMMSYPGNDMAGLKRYLKLKNAYTRDKGWRYWLNKDEEAKLWQQARMPLERFDQKVQQTLAYSRIVAFVSSLFIWIFITPFRAAAQTKKDQPEISSTVTQEEKQKKNSVIAEILGIENFKLGGVVQLKAVAPTTKPLSWGNTSWGKRVTLDLRGKILRRGNFQLNYTGKADLTKTDPMLPYASIEVVPGLNFVDKICLGRIFDPAYQSLSPSLIQTIEFPYHVGFPTDVGISVAGRVGQISWTLARIDGNGGLLLWKDPNRAKDLAVNLTWSPKSFLGLDAFKWRAVYRGGDQVSNGKRFILGIDLFLTKGKVTAEAGLIAHREGAKNLDGGWLLGFATFGKWRPLLQYDYQIGRGGRLTAGLNFLVDKMHRIQLNFEKSLMGNVWRAQYQVGF